MGSGLPLFSAPSPLSSDPMHQILHSAAERELEECKSPKYGSSFPMRDRFRNSKVRRAQGEQICPHELRGGARMKTTYDCLPHFLVNFCLSPAAPPSSSSSCWRLGRCCTFFRPQCTHCTRRKLFRRPSKSSLSQQTANLRKSQGRVFRAHF